ncbi:hypothetical protein As57867_006834, partial [Aphanomyces stellatus]
MTRHVVAFHISFGLSHMQRILVIGGGIGGCVVALALKQKGFDPIVYDKFDLPQQDAPPVTFGNMGGGLSFMSNGLCVLQGLGLLDKVRALGCNDAVTASFCTLQGTEYALFD